MSDFRTPSTAIGTDINGNIIHFTETDWNNLLCNDKNLTSLTVKVEHNYVWLYCQNNNLKSIEFVGETLPRRIYCGKELFNYDELYANNLLIDNVNIIYDEFPDSEILLPELT